MSPVCHLLVALALASGPVPIGRSVPLIAEQRLGQAVCGYRLDTSELALSGELRLTLSIEGPSPVEVEVPQPLTDSPDWRARPSPPRITPLSGGRVRWEQAFRLEPFQSGAVPLPVRALSFRTGNEVRDWQLEWKPQTVRVNSSVAKPDLESARPPADIERIAPAPGRSHFWWYAGMGVALALAACGAAGWLALRRAAKPAITRTPRQKALADLDRLGLAGGPLPEQLPHLADVLRRFLEDHFRLAATRQTTAEFHLTLRQAGILPGPEMERVMEVLGRCDLAKFAGIQFAPNECRALLTLAREAVAGAGEGGQGVTPA